MTVQELLQSVSYLTNSEGQRTAVVIDIAVWQELTTQLEQTWLETKSATSYQNTMADFLQILRDSAIETGIADLAHEHDHYIHGTPKHGRALSLAQQK